MTPESLAAARSQRWQRWAQQLQAACTGPVPPLPGHGAPVLPSAGKLLRATGLVLEATGVRAPVGALCEIDTPAGSGQGPVLAEVMGFTGERAYLMPTGSMQGLTPGAPVRLRRTPAVAPSLSAGSHPWRRSEDYGLHLPMGPGLLGRVLNAMGQPLDAQGPVPLSPETQARPIARRPVNAMQRAPIRTPLDTGVRAINALLTIGRGQRLGLFAGTGVGKSVLLGMMARYTQADVIVVGLIGERGREVKEFIEDILGPQGLARSVVVAAPADAPPLERLQGAAYASAIAEHFRDGGSHVLLLMDSLTRYAMAQREIALAIGEPPATRGYPPSVFAKLPQLVERSGNGLNGVGSITALYTVLTEGDDPQDPIADAARGILDGHIVLSRELAESGHFPAIDVERSLSRVMPAVAPPAQQGAARQVRQWLAKLTRAQDLVQIGAYQAGQDALLDQAVRMQTALNQFLQQDLHEAATLPTSVQSLADLVAAAAPPGLAGRAEPGA